jgi:hypothetical protein
MVSRDEKEKDNNLDDGFGELLPFCDPSWYQPNWKSPYCKNIYIKL